MVVDVNEVTYYQWGMVARYDVSGFGYKRNTCFVVFEFSLIKFETQNIENLHFWGLMFFSLINISFRIQPEQEGEKCECISSQ